MRRILQIITKSELGGAQSHVADLIEGLSQANSDNPDNPDNPATAGRYEVHLATGSEGPLTERARAVGAHVHLLPRLQHSINPVVDLAAVRECAQLIRRVKPHLIHAHSSKAGMVARLAGHRTGVPVVFTVHGWGFNPGPPLAFRVLAWAVEFGLAFVGARIICVSKHSERTALSWGIANPAKLSVIHNGIRADAPQAQPELVPPRAVMVARFAKPKDHDTLLRAVALLNAHGSPEAQGAPDFHLELVGSGPGLDATRTLARELGVEERVTFLGDRQDIKDILRDAQVFVLSTYSEGLPISIMEAMRAGLPVVATDVGGVSEEVEHEQTGWLVPPRDAPALARALQELLADPARRAHMGRAARAKFEREFTRDRMLAAIEAVYNDLWSGAL